jgi:hypothetical protein
MRDRIASTCDGAKFTISSESICGLRSKMPLRTLLIGDLHYGPKNLKDHEVLARAIHAAIDQYALRHPRPTQEAHIPPLDLLISLGDEIDKHDAGAVVRGACVAFLRSLAARTRHMIVLVGNHTRQNNRVSTGPDHTLAELRHPRDAEAAGRAGRIHIVEDPEILEIDGVRFGALPYIDPTSFTDVLEEYCPELLAGGERLAFVVGHQEIRGAQLMPGRESSCEAHWPNEWPPLISGHLHDRHHTRNVFYTGTPMQHSLSEGPMKYIHFGTLHARGGPSPSRGASDAEPPAGAGSAWAYLEPEHNALLPSNRYVSSAGSLYEFRLTGIPVRSKITIDISKAPEVLGHVDQHPQDYFSIHITYTHASDLLASTSYATLMQRPRIRVTAEKRQTQTGGAPATSQAGRTVEGYGSCLRRACADRSDISALLAHIGGWMQTTPSTALPAPGGGVPESA